MAMTNCRECKAEISDQAAACPRCGAPMKAATPPKPKTSGCAWIALIFLAIPFLWAFIGGMNRSSSGQAPARLSDAECMKSLQCWGDRHSARATVACQREVERAAEFQAEWTDGVMDVKFPRFGWVDETRGILRYTGDKVKFQNGFGAWKNMIYTCTFDPNSASPPQVLVLPR